MQKCPFQLISKWEEKDTYAYSTYQNVIILLLVVV